jgi:hypothetical protein
MEFKAYFYYHKNDSKKEAIDKVVALNEQDALHYFAERKQMDEFKFIELYNIEVNEQTKPK